MKNLVLGALLVAAASSAACSSSSTNTDVTVRATWTFTHIADHSARSCPIGFDVVEVVAQEVDPDTIAPIGPELTTPTASTCGAQQDVITVPDGVYLMRVVIENAAGTPYAESLPQLVDTAVDTSFAVEILDDGGYFQFSWGLVDAASKAPMTCAQAGITANGSVEVVSTSVANMNFYKDDKFTCQDHFGTTDGLPAGNYTVSADAEENNAPLGDPVNFTSTITAPNGVTDLGHILIPIN